jgi:hypothetical protein
MQTRTLALALALVPSLFLLANTAPRPTNLVSEMTGEVAAQAQVLWDVTNAAQDDSGNPVVARFKPADWVRIKQAGDRMTASMLRLASPNAVVVRTASQQTMDEKTTPGGLTAAQIQHYVDGNPAAFRAMARSFTGITRQISAAAATHDVGKINAIANDLDQACESCHQTFWYPEAQK